MLQTPSYGPTAAPVKIGDRIMIRSNPARCRLGSVTAGAGPVTARSLPVPARTPPVPARSPPVPDWCRLGLRWCLLGAGSVPGGHGAGSVTGDGSVPAGAGPVTAGAGPVLVRSPVVPAWSPPVPARYRLGHRRLGHRRCWFDAGSVPSGAGSAPTGVGSVPVQFMFTQIKYHRLTTDQSALTPQNSDCIQAMPPFHYPGPSVCIYARSPCSFSKEPIGAS